MFSYKPKQPTPLTPTPANWSVDPLFLERPLVPENAPLFSTRVNVGSLKGENPNTVDLPVPINHVIEIRVAKYCIPHTKFALSNRKMDSASLVVTMDDGVHMVPLQEGTYTASSLATMLSSALNTYILHGAVFEVTASPTEVITIKEVNNMPFTIKTMVVSAYKDDPLADIIGLEQRTTARSTSVNGEAVFTCPRPVNLGLPSYLGVFLNTKGCSLPAGLEDLCGERSPLDYIGLHNVDSSPATYADVTNSRRLGLTSIRNMGTAYGFSLDIRTPGGRLYDFGGRSYMLVLEVIYLLREGKA